MGFLLKNLFSIRHAFQSPIYRRACLFGTLLAQHVAGFEMTAKPEEIATFLGGAKGVLAFVDMDDAKRAKWVNLSDPALAVRPISTGGDVVGVALSPDGGRVAFVKGGDLFLKVLEATNSVRVTNRKVAAQVYFTGAGPEERLLFCDPTPKDDFRAGRTYAIRIAGARPIGELEVLIRHGAMDAGITADGKWMGEAYGGLHLYEVETGQWTDLGRSKQFCSASMAPDGPHRFVTLLSGHREFAIYSRVKDTWHPNRFRTKSREYFWQRPHYSTSSDYVTVLIGRGTNRENVGPYTIYVVHTGTGARLALGRFSMRGYTTVPVHLAVID